MTIIDRRPHGRCLAAISLAALTAGLPGQPALAQEGPREPIVVTGERRALTHGDAAASAAELARVPGGTHVVTRERIENTPVQHVKDVLGYVPGVVVQPRMGDDARVSIRGSGLSRAYGTRGVALLLDGVPLNTADGLIDFFEIDPSAYSHVEVFKGANALRYGANSLGGAINLVTPTGHQARRLAARIDGGSFGYLKAQASHGGAAGALDWFVTGSAQRIEGYRDHSEGNALRAHANLGYRLSADAETRFYLTAARTRQDIPGEVSKRQALETPRAANPVWVEQDQARDVNSLRLANKTSVHLGATAVELGGFVNERHVWHPIYQWLDYTVSDYGGFARAVDDRVLGGLNNRLTVGMNLHNGTIDTEQFENLAGSKGELLASMVDRSANLTFYAEDMLSLRPGLAVVAGVQYLHARRERRDRLADDGDQSGRTEFDLWSPKLGLLWEARPGWQVFANVSRSAEVPSFDVNSFASPATSGLRPQRATTYEIGSRGQQGAIGWNLSLYRAHIRDELQCLTTAPWAPCSPINADRTLHQGIEAGLEAVAVRSLVAAGDSLALTAAYTFNDFRFDGDGLYGDNRLPGVPRHHLRAELQWQHPAGFTFAPNLEWSPRPFYADNANTLAVDPFALLGLRLGYEAASGLSFYVEGRNLTARRYISTVAIAGVADKGSELFNPGTGRAVFAGARMAW
jgi:iron complex outermembrane receptor protein